MSALFQPECVWDLKATLGEGPVWRAAENALWFVDIKQKKLHRFDAATAETRSFDAPSEPGFLAPVRGGGFVVGCKGGLYRFDEADGFRFLSHVEAPHLDNRLNDGFVDTKGRLWFGSMHDPEENPTGRLYRLDARGLKVMDEGYVITNGPALSPDGQTLYHNDTLKKQVYAFDLDAQGEITNKRLFAQLEVGQAVETANEVFSEVCYAHEPHNPHGEGYVDGPAVDSQGNVWVGLFFGGGINVYAPDGRLLRKVHLPVSNVTKVAFGGPDLKTVYATTAAKGLTPEEKAAQPLAGGLFRFSSDVAGQPQNEITFL